MDLLLFLLILTLGIGFFGLVAALFGSVVAFWLDRDLKLFLFSLGLVTVSMFLFWLYFNVVLDVFSYKLLW